MCYVLCVMCSVLCVMCCVLCVMCSVLCVMCSVLCGGCLVVIDITELDLTLRRLFLGLECLSSVYVSEVTLSMYCIE